ncbi:COG4223 family protein, partial [Methylobacterium crusticola]
PAGAAARPASPPPAARGGAGFGSVLTAALLGGVVGAGLLYGAAVYGPAYGLLPGGLLPTPPAESGASSLDQRIADLAPRESVQALDRRLAAAETALRTLPEAVRGADAAAKAATDRANEALRRAEAVPAGGPAAGTPVPSAGAPDAAPNGVVPNGVAPDGALLARLEGLDRSLADLQGKLADPELRQKVDGLSQAVTALQGRTDAADLRARLDGLDKGLKGLQADLGSRTAADEQADKALGQRLDGLQQALDSRGKATDQRLADLAKAVEGRADAGTLQAALRVVAADRIAAALALGAPYADALGTLKQLDPGQAAALAPLEPFAASGAPTAASLSQAFQPLGARMLAASRAAQQRAVAEQGSFGDRLASMAESIVSVRKVGTGGSGPGTAPQADADPTEAGVAKVQDALDRGAIPDAAAAFDALPEAARREGAAFGERLKARAAAGEAARTRLSASFAALPGPGSQPQPAR